ncbi:MAG: hypothetical protein AAGK74_13625 [Chloroflexota bacterium]
MNAYHAGKLEKAGYILVIQSIDIRLIYLIQMKNFFQLNQHLVWAGA